MTDSSSLSSSIGSQSLTNFERNFITITVMIVAIIEILDMTIVNVALPAMMGDLANADQITWILTSYIVLMPLQVFLSIVEKNAADFNSFRLMMLSGLFIPLTINIIKEQTQTKHKIKMEFE